MFVLNSLKQNTLPDLDQLTEEFEMKKKLLSLIQSLRVNPTVFYTTGSSKCQSLAQLLHTELDSLGKSHKSEFTNWNASLLIVDRNKDKITPLRSPWHYQSMIHEYLSYHNAKVRYGGEIAPKEVNMSEVHDEYFRDNLFENFGKIVTKTTEFVHKCSEAGKKHSSSMKTLADLEFIAEKLPEIKRETNLSRKHFEIIELIADLVQKYRLLDVMQVENQILDTKLALQTFEKVRNLILSTETREVDKFRLIFLYMYRYPDDIHKMKILVSDLHGLKVQPSRIDTLKKLWIFLKEAKEKAEGKKGALDMFFSTIRTLTEEHCGHLMSLALSICQQKIDPDHLSTVSSPIMSSPGSIKKPNLLILFVVGGVTIEEMIQIHQHKDCDIEIIMGSTHLINSTTCINEMLAEVAFKTAD